MFHSSFESVLPYRVLAIAVLAVFYGIYFVKLFAQKKRGTKAYKIGERSEKSVHTVEHLMSAATLSVVAVQLVSIIADWSILPGSARFTGFITALAGDALFLAAVLGMRDSWRVGIPESGKTAMVTDGVYAYSRNPAFVGFDLMYIGVCLMYCNVLTVIFSAFAVVMLHMQILQEEKYLSETFGEEYLLYKKTVSRYLGRKSKNGSRL